MSIKRNAIIALTAGAIALTLAACGAAPSSVSGNSLQQTAYSSLSKKKPSQQPSQGIPPQSAFVTIKVTVTKILPEDNVGLPHQNFIVKEISPKAGMILEVNNDTKYGSEVKGLKVGDQLTIRGTEYHNTNKDGIHWTHKANKPGDAGFIQTADGTKYE